MIRLPTLTPKKVITALKKAGFENNGQKGSHFFLWHPVREVQTCVPIHATDLKRGLMKRILKQAGLSEEQFRELL